MRIVHIINSLATGGAETLVVDLVQAAIANGDDAEIVTLWEEDGVPRRRAAAEGLKVTPIGTSKWNPLIPKRLAELTHDADIVHVHLFPSMYWATFLRSRKLVFTEHSTWNRRMGLPATRWLEAIIYRQFLVVFAISNGVKAQLENYLDTLGVATPVVETPNGIRSDFFRQGKRAASPSTRVVLVGSLKESKQPDLAIRAVAKDPNLRLQFAGDGPLRNELENLARDLRVSERVEFLGEVDDIPSVLMQNDVFLSCSKFEGFALVAAEAEATGLPVIGPNVAGFNEVVLDGETGYLYDEQDPQLICSLIKRALQPENYKSLSANAQEHAKLFSIENSYRTQREMYEALT